MKLYEIAKYCRKFLLDNKGWLVLYKKGRSWKYTETFDLKEDGLWVFKDHYPRDWSLENSLKILEADPNAIIVNGSIIIDDDSMDFISLKELTKRLRFAYQYNVDTNVYSLASQIKGIENATLLNCIKPSDITNAKAIKKYITLFVQDYKTWTEHENHWICASHLCQMTLTEEVAEDVYSVYRSVMDELMCEGFFTYACDIDGRTIYSTSFENVLRTVTICYFVKKEEATNLIRELRITSE